MWADLGVYRCSKTTCPYYPSKHPFSARNDGNVFNAAAIPQALAETVAESVVTTFKQRRIRQETEEAEVTNEEVEEFNRMMSED